MSDRAVGLAPAPVPWVVLPRMVPAAAATISTGSSSAAPATTAILVTVMRVHLSAGATG